MVKCWTDFKLGIIELNPLLSNCFSKKTNALKVSNLVFQKLSQLVFCSCCSFETTKPKSACIRYLNFFFIKSSLLGFCFMYINVFMCVLLHFPFLRFLMKIYIRSKMNRRYVFRDYIEPGFSFLFTLFVVSKTVVQRKLWKYFCSLSLMRATQWS
jgi:hypothetical protein